MFWEKLNKGSPITFTRSFDYFLEYSLFTNNFLSHRFSSILLTINNKALHFLKQYATLFFQVRLKKYEKLKKYKKGASLKTIQK